jgi:predicted enzyme related to lactoylglutathione lyase
MNRVVHFEIHAKDLDRMQQFYSDVFGWKITNLGPQMGHYRMVETGENEPGEKWPVSMGVLRHGWESLLQAGNLLMLMCVQ